MQTKQPHVRIQDREAEMLGQHCSKGYSLGCYLPTHENKSEPFIPELAGGAQGALLTQALGDMEELVNF